MFDGDNNPVQFDFYAFDEKGNLVQQCMGISADQELDTTLYFYNEQGVFQEAILAGHKRRNFQREFHFNEKGRLTSISSNNIAARSMRYTYNSENLLDSMFRSGSSVFGSEPSWISFHYNSERKLVKKELYMNYSIMGIYTYEYPDPNSVVYTQWTTEKDQDSLKPASSAKAYFDEKGNVLKLESKDGFDTLGVHVLTAHYDAYGNVSCLLYEEPTGNVQTNYIRDKKGLLMRVEHAKDGVVYNYSVFEYTYR
jgi:hypothetical protein